MLRWAAKVPSGWCTDIREHQQDIWAVLARWRRWWWRRRRRRSSWAEARCAPRARLCIADSPEQVAVRSAVRGDPVRPRRARGVRCALSTARIHGEA